MHLKRDKSLTCSITAISRWVLQGSIHIWTIGPLPLHCKFLLVSRPSRYEELLRGERTIHQELQALERKFETWAQMTNDHVIPTQRPASSQRPLASARDITKDLPPEVATFEVSYSLMGRPWFWHFYEGTAVTIHFISWSSLPIPAVHMTHFIFIAKRNKCQTVIP